MDKIRITHIESGTIHVVLDKYNFIISGSGTKWTEIFQTIEAKPDFWLADIIPEDALNDPSNLTNIHWFTSQSGGFHMKAFAPDSVHLLATDEKADLDIYGKIFEIWNVGVGWVIVVDDFKILFTEKAISSDRETWPEDKQQSKLWRPSELRNQFGVFDIRIVDFTSDWVPTDSGEMFEYDITKKTFIIHSSKTPRSIEAFRDFKVVLQFSEDAKDFTTLDENESTEIKLVCYDAAYAFGCS